MENELLARWVSDLFGFHLVQVGSSGPAQWLCESRIQTRTVVDTLRSEAQRPADDAPRPADGGASIGARPSRVAGRATALPIASDSTDVVVMPHVLEYEADPHAALREAYRVLIPEGHLIITGFSPLSALGLGVGVEHRLAGERGVSSQLNMIRTARAREWLSVLGLELCRWEALFLRPPLRSPRLLARLEWMERVGAAMPWLNRRGAGVYALLASKRVARLTPLRPLPRIRTRLVPARLAGASSAMGPVVVAPDRPPATRPRLVMDSGRTPRERR